MSDQVVIDKIAAETILVPIVGTAPLIIHRFSEKAKRQMLDNMQGRKSPKEVKDPEAEYQAAFYRLKGGGYGFPAIGFKARQVAVWQARRGLLWRGVSRRVSARRVRVRLVAAWDQVLSGYSTSTSAASSSSPIL